MDVDAMLQLYDSAEDLVLSGKEEDLSGKEHKDLPDKTNLLRQITDKMRQSCNNSSGLPITDVFLDKITDIYIFISQHPHSSAIDVATFVDSSKESAKKYLQALVAIDMITPEGGNKKRTYSITQ